MRFHATRNGASLVIEADRGFDARQYALRALGGDEGLTFEPTGNTSRPTVELRWVSSDAGAHPNRHAEVRTRPNRGPWSSWGTL
jgi:hypothetical protein